MSRTTELAIDLVSNQEPTVSRRNLFRGMFRGTRKAVDRTRSVAIAGPEQNAVQNMISERKIHKKSDIMTMIQKLEQQNALNVPAISQIEECKEQK